MSFSNAAMFAIINGIAAAPFQALVMLVARDAELMVEHRNGRLAATIGWLAFALMAAAAVAILAQYGGLIERRRGGLRSAKAHGPTDASRRRGARNSYP